MHFAYLLNTHSYHKIIICICVLINIVCIYILPSLAAENAALLLQAETQLSSQKARSIAVASDPALEICIFEKEAIYEEPYTF